MKGNILKYYAAISLNRMDDSASGGVGIALYKRFLKRENKPVVFEGEFDDRL